MPATSPAAADVSTVVVPTNAGPVIRRRQPKSQRRRDGLIQFARDVTSQNGEDGILHKIFYDILPQSSVRYCCDVGAWDGRHLSNTYSLLVPPNGDGDSGDQVNNAGQPSSPSPSNRPIKNSQCWRGLLIEADITKFHDLQSLHVPLGNTCVNATVSCDLSSDDSLVTILRRHSTTSDWPYDFDFLCIDVDGPDYWLLHQVLVESEFRPKVICIEANPTMPHDIIYIPPQDDTIRHGASLAALVELAEMHDYVLVETTLYNAFFVPKGLYERHFQLLVPDPTIEALHEVTMGTSLYQLYDGTIKLWGCKKLLWHRIAMDEKAMQVLPSTQRIFPFSPNDNDNNNSSNNNLDDEDDETCLLNNKIADGAIDMSPYCSTTMGHEVRPTNSLPLQSSDQSDTTANSPSQSDGHGDKDSSRRVYCSSALLQQLRCDGFALVRGTGIPTQLCQAALRVTNSFLHEADESVRRSCLSPNDRARRGYSPMNTENFASLLGQDGPNDLVRKFRMGPPIRPPPPMPAPSSSHNELPVDQETLTTTTTTTTPSSSSSLLRPNVWPIPTTSWDEHSFREFQSTLEEYYDRICASANAIVHAICDGLVREQPILGPTLLEAFASIRGDLDDDTNNDDVDVDGNGTHHHHHHSRPHHGGLAHTSILTLLGYRTGTRHKLMAQKNRSAHPLVAAHTDVGVITVLLYDGGDCAVLQRKVGPTKNTSGGNHNDNNNNNGRGSLSTCDESIFEDVLLPRRRVPKDPIFVVNVADCLSELTCNYLPSTIHRVMPQRGGTIPRNCLALFVGLDPDQTLTLFVDDNDDDHEKKKTKYVTTYETWRKTRIARSQKVLQRTKRGGPIPPAE